MQEMSRKNKLFTDSVIRRMTRVSLACGAINLAQGFLILTRPRHLLTGSPRSARPGPHQYPITMGANFRRRWRAKLVAWGRALDPDTGYGRNHRLDRSHGRHDLCPDQSGRQDHHVSPRILKNYCAQAIMADCEPVFVPLVLPEFNFDANVLEGAFGEARRPF